MIKKLWEQQRRKTIDELIMVLLAHMDGGLVTNWHSSVALKELLASMTDEATLFEIYDSDVITALHRLKSQNEKSIRQLEVNIISIVQARKANLIQTEWISFIPLELEITDEIGLPLEFDICGVTATVKRAGNALENISSAALTVLRNKAHLESETGVNDASIPDYFMIVSCKDYSSYRASSLAAKTFRTFKGILEFLTQFAGWRYSSRGIGARAHIAHPRWLFVEANGKAPEWFHFKRIWDDDHKSNLKLDAPLLMAANKSLLKINDFPKEGTTHELIVRSLGLYSAALDQSLYEDTFIEFWKLAEALTLSERYAGKTDIVVRRLSWYGLDAGFKGSGYRHYLKTLADKRNSIIHKSEGDADAEVLNIMQFACELALNWIIANQPKIITLDQLESEYKKRQLPPSKQARICPACEHHFIPWRVWWISRWTCIRCPKCSALLNRSLDWQGFVGSILFSVLVIGTYFLPLHIGIRTALALAIIPIMMILDALTVRLVTAGKWRGRLKGYKT